MFDNIKLGNSIFGRLLFTFLLIIVPLYFGGFSIYSWGMRIVNKEIVNSMVTQVDNYLDELEREIQNIKDLQFQACVNDDDFGQLSLIAWALDDISRTKAVNRLRQRLEAIRSSSRYIVNVNAYIPALDRVVYAADGVGKIPDENYEMLKNSRSDTLSQIIYWQDKLYLVAAFPQQNMSTGRNPRLIEVELSVKKLKDALIQIDSVGNRGTLLISPSNGLKIANGFDEETTANIEGLLEQKLLKKKRDTFNITIDNKPYIAIYSTSEYLDMVLCKYIPEEQVFADLYRYQKVFLIFTAAAIIIIILFTFSTNRLIHQPLLKLVKSFKKVENGNLGLQIEHRHNDEFRYLYHRFNAMVENLNILIDQVYKQKILAQKAELKHLQSQINPHFLYNSFFSLNNMVVKGEYENVEQFTQQLGTYFQFITRSGADMVPLEKEIAHARIYADIQGRRFRNRIRVEFQELPEELKNIIVPRLILQPVIENSFEHGLKNMVRDGIVRIMFAAEPGRLLMTVEDNGQEISADEINRMNCLLNLEHDEIESTGIINIHRRIQLKYGPESGMRFSMSELAGLKVEILIIYEIEEVKNDDVQAADS